MVDFTLHDETTAPEKSVALLAESRKKNGRLPGLHATMAEAPGLLEGYQQLHQLFLDSSFDNDEKTVVWQSINVEHECHYCVPAHTGMAKRMKVDEAISNALRNGTALPTERLQALRTFTLLMVRERGAVSDEAVQTFLDAGYTKRQVLEVILGLAQKVMSNYTNHIAHTPVDSTMEQYAWNGTITRP
jgi:alkylhydroperoxidase family enzyme